MEIITVPIVEYFRYCSVAARENGFLWIMFLLARDADAEAVYHNIKKYWNSLDDLTGKTILFLFAGNLDYENQTNSDYLLRNGTDSWRAINTHSARFVNQNIPTIPDYKFPSRRDYGRDEIDDIDFTHTRSISALRDYFGLSEKDVPSLVFISPDRPNRDRKIVIRLDTYNVYEKLKSILELLEEPIHDYQLTQENIREINHRINALENEKQHTQKSKKVISRFLSVKKYLNILVSITEDSFEKEHLKKAMQVKSDYGRDEFVAETRINLCSYHNFLLRYPAIESDSRDYLMQIKNFDSELSNLNKLHEMEVSKATISYSNLSRMLEEMDQHSHIKGVNNIGERRFKVALSFSGEQRAKVSLIADGLASRYGKEKILYDKFHRAEFSRPNLDTHLQDLYRFQSELIVVFICADYKQKEWCGIEWRSIRDLLNQNGTDDRIMFVKCGKGSINGVFGTIDGFLDLDEVTMNDAINDIMQRYDSLC